MGKLYQFIWLTEALISFYFVPSTDKILKLYRKSTNKKCWPQNVLQFTKAFCDAMTFCWLISYSSLNKIIANWTQSTEKGLEKICGSLYIEGE